MQIPKKDLGDAQTFQYFQHVSSLFLRNNTGQTGLVGKSNLLARVVTSNGGNLGLGQADEAGETGFWHICRCCDTIDKQRLTKNLKLQKGEVLEKLFSWLEFPRHLALEQCQKTRTQVQPLRSYVTFGQVFTFRSLNSPHLYNRNHNTHPISAQICKGQIGERFECEKL